MLKVFHFQNKYFNNLLYFLQCNVMCDTNLIIATRFIEVLISYSAHFTDLGQSITMFAKKIHCHRIGTLQCI